MPIYVSRDTGITNLLIAKFVGDWDWSDYNRSLDEIKDLIDDPSQPWYQLLDFSQTATIPRGASRTHVARGSKLGRAQLSLFIGNRIYIRTLYGIVSNAGVRLPADFPDLVENIEEARLRIRAETEENPSTET